MKPRIAIPVPTTSDLPYNARSWPAYAAAVERSGGESVRIELSSSLAEIKALAATCQGLCLPGSPADVDPGHYGADLDPATSPADPAREAADFALLEHAFKSGQPVLGICYGVQSLNVWRGGSLIQDLTPLPVNHSAGGKVAIAHTALIPEHSLLGELLLAGEDTRAEAPLTDGYLRLPINTSHHQAISEPGNGMKIGARCPEDGVVEAIERAAPNDIEGSEVLPAFVLGIQWHPERSYDISPASRALFNRLVSESAKFLTA